MEALCVFCNVENELSNNTVYFDEFQASNNYIHIESLASEGLGK